MTRPLPCPFCGKANPAFRFSDKDSSFKAMNCDFNDGGCGAEGGYEQGEDGAIEKWNRRATPAAGLTEEDVESIRLLMKWAKGSFDPTTNRWLRLASKLAALAAEKGREE